MKFRHKIIDVSVLQLSNPSTIFFYDNLGFFLNNHIIG